MRTYISPIGFNSTSVTRPVLSRGVDTGDVVVLIRPVEGSDDSRAEEARKDVERMLTEIEPDVTLETEQIPHDDFPSAVLACSDVIRAAEPSRIVNLGGGARDVLLPFAFAATAHVPLLDTALFFSDIDGTVREWELPRLTPVIEGTTVDTLETIADTEGWVSIPDLTERTGQSKSTVTRHVTRLEQRGFVDTDTRGKTKYARVTITGRLGTRVDADFMDL